MEIKQIRSFVAIAESGTFTAGAKQLNLTQAAVSMQIQQLEKEVGLPLFTRTSRRVILTEAGECLLRRSRSILRECDAAIAEISEIAGAEFGRLRVGSASAGFASVQLPDILERLREKFPLGDVTVCSGTSEVLAERILANEIDIALVSLPVESPGIETQTLFTDDLVAIAHPDHARAARRSVTARQLAKEQLILGEKGGNTRRMIDGFFEAARVKPNIVMELSRQEAINKMVENGMGVGVAGKKQVARQTDAGRLVSWEIEGASLTWDLGLARLRGGYNSPIAKEFVELCKESFQRQSRRHEAGAA